MFYWFGEGFFCVPSQTAQTRPKSPTIDSKLLGPLVEIQSLAAKGNIKIYGLVIPLLFSSGPSDIAWDVVPAVVCAFNCVKARWRIAHFSSKPLETMVQTKPVIRYLNASNPVNLGSLSSTIATRFHGHPRLVKFG